MELIVKNPTTAAPLPAVEWNYQEMRAELEKKLAAYKGAVYTAAQMPQAKKDRATLNKVRDQLDTARKELRAYFLAPYNEFEAQMKELLGLVAEAVEGIDAQVKAVEQKEKDEKQEAIRGLAWIVLRWAGTVRPRVIILENVEEFVTWGPVRKGKPIKKKAGQTFQQWKRQLVALGYDVEHREIVAADFGAPTTRKRFVLVARCDGRPIVWPERTHAPQNSEDVQSGILLPWRSASEIIDWSLPCYSVFSSKSELKEKYGVNAIRPLADNTMRRVIRGVDKFTIRSGKPFIVECNHIGTGHMKDVESPLGTILAKHAAGVASPSLIQYHTEQTERVRANGLGDPLPTVDAANRYGLTTAQLVEYFGNGHPIDVRKPMHTVTSHDREALACGHIVEFKGKDIGQESRRPLRTITAGGGEFSVCRIELAKTGKHNLEHWPEVRTLLNRYCGYDLASNEILLLEIRGAHYFIADILLRMLTPRELYNAMGFPPDYIIDRDYLGNEYSKTKQVARCGNAVCPPIAEAMVRANLPEWCNQKLSTMAEFIQSVAV